MITEGQAAEMILDCDGSCRVVTFMPTTKEAIIALVNSLMSRYHAVSASDNDGTDRLQQLDTDELLSGIDGFLHVVLADGDGLIRHLQLFINEDHDPGAFCLEVSFYPSDIDAPHFSFRKFSGLIESWNGILEADDFFVRYENASWDLYDPFGLGVIYSCKQPPSTS